MGKSEDGVWRTLFKNVRLFKNKWIIKLSSAFEFDKIRIKLFGFYAKTFSSNM